MNMNYTFFPVRDRFSAAEFASPPSDCGPVYSWCWNGPVSREETDRQLAEFRRMGIDNIYILPSPSSSGRAPC